MAAKKFPIPFEIITCPQWDAKPPKQGLTLVRKANKTIFHHTAGHHPELDGKPTYTRQEAIQYAKNIQAAHMAPGGLGIPQGGDDSGHNFLVCRNGLTLQGRWLTVSAIQAGHMIASAHCPGQNNQIGIEHEHFGVEEMTKEQKESSSMLMAWIAWHYGLKKVLPSMPHSRYFPTSCPANLVEDIAAIVRRAQVILNNCYAV